MKHLVKAEPYTGGDEIVIAGHRPDVDVVIYYRPWPDDDEIVCKARIAIFRNLQTPVVVHVKQFPGSIWVLPPDTSPELVKAFNDDQAYAPEVLANIVFRLFGLDPYITTWVRGYTCTASWDIVVYEWGSTDGITMEATGCRFVPVSKEEVLQLFLFGPPRNYAKLPPYCYY
jgi:hypothetical protein